MSQSPIQSDITPQKAPDQVGEQAHSLDFGDLDFDNPDYRRYRTGRLPAYWIQGRGGEPANKEYVEFVDAHMALLKATTHRSIRSLHQKSAALFHRYAEREGVSATLVERGSFLRVRIEPQGRSHLNWYAALVIRSGGSGVYYDPARIRTLEGASGAYIPKFREILLGRKGVQNLHTLNSTRLHELLHLRNDMELLEGIDAPYQGAFLSHSKREKFTDKNDQETVALAYGSVFSLDETQVRDLVFCYLKKSLAQAQGYLTEFQIAKELLILSIDGLKLAREKKRLFEGVLEKRPPLLPATSQPERQGVLYRECSLGLVAAPRATLCLPLPGVSGCDEETATSAFYEKAQRSYDATLKEIELFKERMDICAALIELGKKNRITHGLTPLFNYSAPETVAAYKKYSGNGNPTRCEILSNIVRPMTGFILATELSEDEHGCIYRSQYSQGKIILDEGIKVDQKGKVTEFFTKGLLARVLK